MFFTKAGRVAAQLTFALVILHLGYLVVFAWQNGPMLPGNPKYPGFQTQFKMDMLVLGASICLGVLSEISQSLSARSDH